MATLVDAFPIGCRVRLSSPGRRMGAVRASMGVVVGHSRIYHALRVLRDGRAAVITTHADHWERVLEPQIEEHW